MLAIKKKEIYEWLNILLTEMSVVPYNVHMHIIRDDRDVAEI